MHDKQFCYYHRETPATWRCAPCRRLFGDCCMPLNADDVKVPTCPLCVQKLEYLGAANTAQPFWERIPFFFGYALQKGPLLFYLIMALAAAFLPPLLMLIVYCIVTKYLCTMLVSISHGEMEAPPAREAFQGDGFAIFFKIIAIFFVTGALLALTRSAGLFAMVSISLVITLLLPAMIIVLAMDNELTQALNPRALLRLTQAMGWHYLILWVFLFILSQSPLWLAFTVLQHLPEIASGLIFWVVQLYFSAVMFAMMGYAVFQYQGALGDVAGDWTEAALPENEYTPSHAKARAEIYIREGRHADAIAVLGEALKAQPRNAMLHERYHKLQLAHGNTGGSAKGNAEQGRRHLFNAYLPLIINQTPERAATLYLAARQRWSAEGVANDDLIPGDPALCEQLAKALLQQRKIAEGLTLLNNFHRRFPDSPHIPRAYLLAAQTFSHELRDPQSAGKLTAFIRKRYPDFPQMADVKLLEAGFAK